MNRQHAESGFTLIELVVVIVILGILAATAMPKFLNLKTDAANAAASGVAGALASASAMNYASKLAGNSNAVTAKSCSEFLTMVNQQGYSITNGGASFSAGAQVTDCKVGTADGSAYFTAIGA